LTRLLEYAASHIQHMQKALTEMNLQLHHVVADITGATGLRIIRAILAGERDPAALARLRDTRCHASVETITKALTGHYRAAAGLAMAGQAAETSVQCRAMLEYAAYAVHVHQDPSLSMVWLNRHQGEAEMKAQKDAFTHRRVAAWVTAANRHAGERFENMYQRTTSGSIRTNARSLVT
jgi:hypothetical protein